jgi:hypothetical protein
MRATLASLAAISSLLLLAGPVRAAAPNYILVSGPGVDRPILLGNWKENLELLSAVVQAPRAKGPDTKSLARRPRLELSEFWGWGGLPRPTRPGQANQHGWFYPAYTGRRAIVELTVDGSDVPRFASAGVLRILARHGVPTRM